MTVTILDTQTGTTVQNSQWNAEWWEWGNGACDCNRHIFHGHPGTAPGPCMGHHRYLITACDDPEVPLRDLNCDYPIELLQEHGIV